MDPWAFSNLKGGSAKRRALVVGEGDGSWRGIRDGMTGGLVAYM